MKIHYKDTIKKLVLLLMASLLLAFGSNWYTVQEKEQWQADSEELIWNRISNAMENGLWADGGFIGLVKSVQGESTDFPTVYEKGIPGGSDFSVYDRQVGLQGTVGAAFAMAAKRLGVSAYFVQRILWITTTGLMIFMLLLLAKWACFEWGGAAAAGTLACLVLAPWMQRSVANIYWVIWTMTAPMVVTAYWGYCVKRKKHLAKGLAEAFLFAMILVRFFCGYEFTTTVMLASELPILYYFLQADTAQERKSWVWIAFKIGVLELAAFALSFGILGLQNMAYRHTDFVTAMNTVIDAARFRTGSFTEMGEVAGYVTDSAIIETVQNATGWSVLKQYLTSEEEIFGSFDFRRLLVVTMFVLAIKGILCKTGWKAICREELFLLATTIPAISWYYIGYGHAVFHFHVDYILWDVAFLPLGVALLFKACGELYRHYKNNSKELKAA